MLVSAAVSEPVQFSDWSTRCKSAELGIAIKIKNKNVAGEE